MAMTARVSNMGGKIVAEKRGGTYRLFQHDALGSVISVFDEAGNVTDTYEYWPYGEVRTSSGSSSNPWKFCGAWGYYTDVTSRQYVRARTLRNDLGCWMTVDPLWPSFPTYIYAKASPVLFHDPSGLQVKFKNCDDDKKKQLSCCDRIKPDSIDLDKFVKCMATTGEVGMPSIGGWAALLLLGLLRKLCSGERKMDPVCITCASEDNTLPGLPKECNQCGTKGPSGSPTLGFAIPIIYDHNPWLQDACKLATITPWCNAPPQKGCTCSIYLCKESFSPGATQAPCAILFHEMGHCSGMGHQDFNLPPGVKMDKPLDAIYKLGCCACIASSKEANQCGPKCSRIERHI